MTFLIGLDLGQASDYTATAVIERLIGVDLLASYHCRHLERYPLGTTYPAVVRKVQALALAPQLSHTVDKNNVLVSRFRNHVNASQPF